MAFNLDPVSALGAIKKAKGWQGQPFSGNTSPMNFSSGLVARPERGSNRAVQDIGPWKERPFPQQIILPETGVFSSDGVRNITDGHFASFEDSVKLGREGLDGLGRKHRAEKYYEFAKKIAEERKKAQEEKERGALGSSIGGLIGTIGGTLIGGPMVGSITGRLGRGIGGSIG